jgi:hypothetical protein
MNLPNLIKKKAKITKPLYKTHITSIQNPNVENVDINKWKAEV